MSRKWRPPTEDIDVLHSQEAVLTVRQAAEKYRLRYGTLAGWAVAGRLGDPAGFVKDVRGSRRIAVYAVAAIEAAIAAHGDTAVPEGHTTADDAARRLGVPARIVSVWCRKGRLPAAKGRLAGNTVWYPQLAALEVRVQAKRPALGTQTEYAAVGELVDERPVLYGLLPARVIPELERRREQFEARRRAG